MTKYQEFSNPEVALPAKMVDLWKQTILNFVKLPHGLAMPADPMRDDRFWHYLVQSQGENIVELWEAFTVERENLKRYLMDPKREAVAYLTAFHPANQARLLGTLARIDERSNLLTKLFSHNGQISLFDIGAGTGAISQLFAYLLKMYGKGALTVDLIEARKAFLDMATYGLELIDPSVTVRQTRGRMEKSLDLVRRHVLDPQSGLLILGMGYVWNEVQSIKPLERGLLQLMTDLVKQQRKAMIVIMEPSNQNIARSAMQLRDHLVLLGYAALYPCPGQMSCPLLERSRDWCYSEFSFSSPRVLKKVDKLLDIERSRLGAASYIMVSPALYADLTFKPHSHNVVVGRPVKKSCAAAKRHTYKKAAGEVEYLLCTPEGLTKASPLKDSAPCLRGECKPD